MEINHVAEQLSFIIRDDMRTCHDTLAPVYCQNITTASFKETNTYEEIAYEIREHYRKLGDLDRATQWLDIQSLCLDRMAEMVKDEQ